MEICHVKMNKKEENKKNSRLTRVKDKTENKASTVNYENKVLLSCALLTVVITGLQKHSRCSPGITKILPSLGHNRDKTSHSPTPDGRSLKTFHLVSLCDHS